MGDLLVLFAMERMSLHQAVFRSFACCKLSVPKELVGASGFEPPTSWSRRLVARRINMLHHVLWKNTNSDKHNDYRRLALRARISIALGRDWWWAQNWAHPRGVNPSVETVWNWHTCSLMVFPSHSFSSLSGWHSAGEAEASSAGEQLTEE
jgi:hypothetical protein